MIYIEFVALCIGFLVSSFIVLFSFFEIKEEKIKSQSPFKDNSRHNPEEEESKIKEIIFCIVVALLCFFIGIDYGKDLFIAENKIEEIVHVIRYDNNLESRTIVMHYFVIGENGKKYRVSKKQQKRLKTNHFYKITYYKNSKRVIDFEETKEEKID